MQNESFEMHRYSLHIRVFILTCEFFVILADVLIDTLLPFGYTYFFVVQIYGCISLSLEVFENLSMQCCSN